MLLLFVPLPSLLSVFCNAGDYLSGSKKTKTTTVEMCSCSFFVAGRFVLVMGSTVSSFFLVLVFFCSVLFRFQSNPLTCEKKGYIQHSEQHVVVIVKLDKFVWTPLCCNCCCFICCCCCRCCCCRCCCVLVVARLLLFSCLDTHAALASVSLTTSLFLNAKQH